MNIYYSNNTNEKTRYQSRYGVHEKNLLHLCGLPVSYRLWYRTFSWVLFELYYGYLDFQTEY